MKQQVQALGGRVVPQWTKECLCLVMTKLTVTQKVCPALMYMCVDDPLSVYDARRMGHLLEAGLGYPHRLFVTGCAGHLCSLVLQAHCHC